MLSDANAPAGAASEPVGVVYDIQGFSVHDGPGIRTTIFLKGCPLHCPWCHSPESQRFDIQLSWQWRNCMGTEACGLCLDCCPRDAIGLGDVSYPVLTVKEAVVMTNAAASDEPAAGEGGNSVDSGIQLVQVDWDACDDCGICTERCPSGALSMWGKRYTVSEVVARVLRDRPFFEKSGGGVTVSGGEPLSQAEFALALLRALKEQGVHTALDTTAYASWSVLEETLPYVDLFLLDLKCMDSEAHKAAVGVHNERILENARKLAAAGARMQIRVPVIPRFNDSGENLHAVGRFAKEFGEAVTLVQLLPYHALGVPKWERIKHDGSILQATAPSDKRVAELKAILEEYGLPVQVH
jgi:pyruvate formate lyase activating enzyme